MAKKDSPIYGIWKVTTQGDCEGRSTECLGYYEGYIDEIAQALADKAYYSLTFRSIKINKVTRKSLKNAPKRKEVKFLLWLAENENMVDYANALSDKESPEFIPYSNLTDSTCLGGRLIFKQGIAQ